MRILSTMRAVYPAETLLCSWSSRSLPRRVIGWESAQLNAITSLATLFVTPSLRVRFASHAPASPWLSGGFGYGLYEGSSGLQNGVVNTEIHRNVATAQFGAGIDVRIRLKLLFPIGLRSEVRDFHTLETPSFGVPAQRTHQHNVVVSGGLVVHF